MPTVKPRITITLTPEQHTVLSEMSGETGQSMSSIVVELVESAVPVFVRVVKLVREAKTAHESVKRGIREATEEVQSRLMPINAEALLNLDMFEEEVRRMIGAGGGEASARGGVPPTGGEVVEMVKPPSSNTGVRFNRGRGVEQGKGAKK